MWGIRFFRATFAIKEVPTFNTFESALLLIMYGVSMDTQANM